MKRFSLGVNYWSRNGAIFMWEDEYWNPNVVEEEVETMKELGIEVCRSFILLPSFLPSPNTLSRRHVERFRTFLNICSHHGLKVAPTFIVGHMSGENWDPPFRDGRDLYTDPFMLNQQEFVITHIVSQIKDLPSIWGYVLTNEMPLYGGVADPEKVYSWAKRLVTALRSIDPAHPVGIGDGNWNVLGGNNGFEIQRVVELADYLGPHMYLSETDDYRHGMLTEFIVAALRQYGKPVILEEFGAPSSHASDENIALYYREVFHNVFFAGGVGAWGWCLNDFEYHDELPYLHHPFELRFGILHSDGNPKPAAFEFERFRSFLEDKTNAKPPKAEAALLIPSWYNVSYPFGESDPEDIRRHAVQSMVLAAKAGFGVDILFEQDDPDFNRYRLIILPSMQRYLGTTWVNLREYVENGGNVYLSYYAGRQNFQFGLWIHSFEDLTGCRHNMRYGLPDYLPNPLKLSFHGTSWELRYPMTSPSFDTTYLPIEPLDSSVKILEMSENLKLAVKPSGRGNFIFLNFPLEHLLAITPYANQKDRSQIVYDFLATVAKIDVYKTDNPMVRVRRMENRSKTEFYLQNVSWRTEEVSKVILPGRSIPFKAVLKPKEVTSLML